MPAPAEVAAWPLVMDVAGRYYLEPEAGGLLVSPADETPSEPVRRPAEELDVALALERVAAATGLTLRTVRTAWAGLRTFAPDRLPVIGEDPDAPGFWWLVGQGGAGIKTSPALGAMLAGRDHRLGVDPSGRSGAAGTGAASFLSDASIRAATASSSTANSTLESASLIPTEIRDAANADTTPDSPTYAARRMFTLPLAALRHVPIIDVGTTTPSEVPLAIAAGMPNPTTIAGTITIPPPTPSKPASTPVAHPTMTRAAAPSSDSGARPVASLWSTSRRRAVATSSAAKA